MTTSFSPALMDKMTQMRHPIMGMTHDQAAFRPLQQPGNRLIIAADGLYTEVRRAWLYARFRVAQTPTAYGRLDECIISRYRPNNDELRRFQQQAIDHGRVETAAWVIWNEFTGATRYLPLQAKVANCVRIEVDRPTLAPGEHLVLDLHSHHVMAPEFSGTDDRDDLASRDIKFAAVIGRIEQGGQWAFRLCVEGHDLRGEAPSTTFEYGDLP